MQSFAQPCGGHRRAQCSDAAAEADADCDTGDICAPWAPGQRRSSPMVHQRGRSRRQPTSRSGARGAVLCVLLSIALSASLCARSCGNGLLTRAHSASPGRLWTGSEMPHGTHTAAGRRAGLFPAGPTLRLRGGATEVEQRLRVLQVLHDCLEATLAVDASLREQGERTLRGMQHEVGFLPAMVELIETPAVRTPVKAAGAIFLKNLVKMHWARGAPRRDMDSSAEVIDNRREPPAQGPGRAWQARRARR
jgi:hypothetical protein